MRVVFDTSKKSLIIFEVRFYYKTTKRIESSNLKSLIQEQQFDQISVKSKKLRKTVIRDNQRCTIQNENFCCVIYYFSESSSCEFFVIIFYYHILR